MPCNCTGSHIFGRLQKLSNLQKLQTISKGGLCAYNEHVENTTQTIDAFDGSLPLCRQFSTQSEHWSPPSLRAPDIKTPLTMSALSLHSSLSSHQQASRSLSEQRNISTAATKASPAYLKTQQLFEDDRQFALQQQHASSPRIAAAQRSSDRLTSARQEMAQLNTHMHHAGDSAMARSGSDSVSVADSASSYHGYAGVNYQAGIKDIDDVPNHWGYSLKDYKVIFGKHYVHGCVPWEDQHISKSDQKAFQQLHSRRVQLLQELHGIEQGIRELMQ